MVTVGPFPSQFLWNVDAAQPSVLACQQLTNLLRPVVWSTGSKYEFNLPRYLLPWLSRMLDELRAPKTKVVHIDEKVTHLVHWNFQSLRLILFNSFAPFTTPSRANTYIHRQTWYLKTCLCNRIKLQNKENKVYAKKYRRWAQHFVTDWTTI